jgi:hypothetical protein
LPWSRIGEHDFAVTGHGEDVDIHAHFKVRATFIPLYGYWDESFVTESRLLNSQTGEFESVNLTRHGVETLQVSGQSLAASGGC